MMMMMITIIIVIHVIGPSMGTLEFYFRPLLVGFAANKVAKEQICPSTGVSHCQYYSTSTAS